MGEPLDAVTPVIVLAAILGVAGTVYYQDSTFLLATLYGAVVIVSGLTVLHHYA